MTVKKELEASKPESDLSSLTPGEAFDKFLHYVGGTGKWQWKMFLVTSFCGVFTAFHNLAAGKVD